MSAYQHITQRQGQVLVRWLCHALRAAAEPAWR